jgi:hypothetical protein
MAKLSRNARKKARTKRTLSQTRRELRFVTGEYVKTHLTLVAVLARAGGEVEMGASTMMQVQSNLANLSWAIAPVEPVEGAEPGEPKFKVRIVVREQPTYQPTEGDGADEKVQVTRLPDEDDEVVASREVGTDAIEDYNIPDTVEEGA